MPENNTEAEWLGSCFYCNREATAKVKGKTVCRIHTKALAYIEKSLKRKEKISGRE